MTFVQIEEEFNRFFRLVSEKECLRNSRLMKQMLKIRKRLFAIKLEAKRQKFSRLAEV